MLYLELCLKHALHKRIKKNKSLQNKYEIDRELILVLKTDFWRVDRGYLLFCCEYHKYFHQCNENISIFMSVKHEWKFECFHYTRWKFLWNSLNKFSFYFIVNTPMRARFWRHNYITKQNMNIIVWTFSAFKHVKHWRNKNKKFRQIKIILLPKCSSYSN